MTSFRPIGEVAATIASAAARGRPSLYRGFLITYDPMVMGGLDWSFADDLRGDESPARQGRAKTEAEARLRVDEILFEDVL